MSPLVTIGLPVYNGERHLPLALDALLGQTLGDLELVISDNASTDATEAICRERARRDPRVRYVRQAENVGASRNFNLVFELGRAPYFKWATHDDLCAPAHVERCVQALRSHPSAALAYTRTRIIDGAGTVVGDFEDRLDIRDPRPAARLSRFFREYSLSNALFGVGRRDVFARTRLFEPFRGSDINFLAEVAYLGPLIEVPEPLFFRRFHETCSSWKRSHREQAEFYDPRTAARPPLARWRHHWALLRMVGRHGMPLRERLRAGVYVGRRMLWERGVLAGEVARVVRRSLPGGAAIDDRQVGVRPFADPGAHLPPGAGSRFVAPGAAREADRAPMR